MVEYTKEIQAVLDFIEGHLDERLDVYRVAKTAGFSRYHFQRIFKGETGMGLYEYIQKRRLANAALLLRSSSLPVIYIALQYGFDSQEAFTRAFKKVYGLPPGQYRKILNHVIYGGLDQMDEEKIKHWITTGTAPDKYKLFIDHTTFHTGTRSACICSIDENYGPDEYATIMQQFSAADYRGKRVRFSGFVKSSEVSGWAGLWMRLDGNFSVTLKLDNMQNRPIQGTHSWQHYACVLDVPDETVLINIGILLCGQGTVWLDNVSFQEVDGNVPVTEFKIEKEYPSHPENLSFED